MSRIWSPHILDIVQGYAHIHAAGARILDMHIEDVATVLRHASLFRTLQHVRHCHNNIDTRAKHDLGHQPLHEQLLQRVANKGNGLYRGTSLRTRLCKCFHQWRECVSNPWARGCTIQFWSGLISIFGTLKMPFQERIDLLEN